MKIYPAQKHDSTLELKEDDYVMLMSREELDALFSALASAASNDDCIKIKGQIEQALAVMKT